MKDFDLKAALQGARLITKCGMKVTNFHFSQCGADFPITATVKRRDGGICTVYYNTKGQPLNKSVGFWLMMKTDRKGNYIYDPDPDPDTLPLNCFQKIKEDRARELEINSHKYTFKVCADAIRDCINNEDYETAANYAQDIVNTWYRLKRITNNNP